MVGVQPSESPLSKFARIFVRITLLLAFATWWGGFTFYASVVVPVGSEILGSSRTQGFITQVVTHRLNMAAALTIFAIACDVWVNRHSRKKKHIFLETGIALGLLVCLATLVFLHPKLDELIDLSGEAIFNEDKFYRIHQAYLWVSSAQWVLGALWMACFATWFYNAKQISSAEPSQH